MKTDIFKIKKLHYFTSVFALTAFLVIACGNKNNQSAPISNVVAPVAKIEIPSGELVDPECVRISETVGNLSIADNERQISFILDEVISTKDVETAVLSNTGQLLSSRRLCTSKAESVLLSLPAGAQRVSILARDRSLGLTFSLENIPTISGMRSNYGRLQGRRSASFNGSVELTQGSSLTGIIEELNWRFDIVNSSVWSSGALPPGQWSIGIRDSTGRTARWSKMLLGDKDLSLGGLNLLTEEHRFSPLWSGVLNTTSATFLLSTQPAFNEMRISSDPAFINSYWMPIRQIFTLPIQSSGKYRVFAQFRASDGNESPILMSEFTAQVLNLSNLADAVVSNPLVGVEDPQTTVVTTPPPGAVEHSVTVDVEDLPRNWMPVATPLVVQLKANLEACGRRILYIKFRDSAGRESPSLQRNLDVRCWEKSLPTSPLAARYEHGATALTLSTDPDAQRDAVLIWGGRNTNQVFSDGAILKKVGDAWTWQALPSPPAELTPRTKPNIVVGKNHVLIFGGEELNGQPATGWAFFNFRNNQWISQSTTGNSFGGTPPPAIKNAAGGYVKVTNTDRTEGAFLIVGGELSDQTISDKWYTLVEPSGGFGTPRNWEQHTLKRAVSRAGYNQAALTSLFFIHSGLSTPSGAPGSSQPDASGSAPELSGDIQAFAFSYKTATSTHEFHNYQFKSHDSRTGALNGQLMILSRPEAGEKQWDEAIELHKICVYGGQTYTDELPNMSLPEGFGLRVGDAYFFAPIGRIGICFQPTGAVSSGTEIGYLKNYYLQMSGAPSARRLLRTSAVAVSSATYSGGLFFWSGLAVTGGEYLSDGAMYYSSHDKWVPISHFEAPAPRNMHSAVYMVGQKRILIWGGLTAQGPSAEGAFYVIP